MIILELIIFLEGKKDVFFGQFIGCFKVIDISLYFEFDNGYMSVYVINIFKIIRKFNVLCFVCMIYFLVKSEKVIFIF